MERVLLSELTWPEVRALLDGGEVDTAVIAVGATEQHGYHLPLGTDALLAQAIGERLAARLGRALLAPPVGVGRSDHHMAFPGTITLRQDTLARLVGDYVASLARHGFRNVVLVPTHGGNFGPLASILPALREANPGVNLVDYTDVDRFLAVLQAASAAFGVSPEASGAHSGESETSFVLALRPDLVRMERAKAGYLGSSEEVVPIVFARGIAAVNPDGVLGDPRSATAAKGEVYLARIVEDIVQSVQSRLR